MSTFGIVVSVLMVAILIFYIGFNTGANFESAKNSDFEEKYVESEKQRLYWKKKAENPPQILSVKMIGESYVKDFTIKR